MRTFLYCLFLILLTSCAPDGIENDRLEYVQKDSNVIDTNSLTDFINKAILTAKLYQDTIGNYDQALYYLDSALTIDKGSSKALRIKSHVLCLKNDPKTALETINNALTNEPNNEDNHLTKAYVLLQLGNKSDAYKSYLDVIKINSKNFKAQEAICYMDIDNKNLPKGCACLKQLRDNGYENANRQADSLLCGLNWR